MRSRRELGARGVLLLAGVCACGAWLVAGVSQAVVDSIDGPRSFWATFPITALGCLLVGVSTRAAWTRRWLLAVVALGAAVAVFLWWLQAIEPR